MVRHPYHLLLLCKSGAHGGSPNIWQKVWQNSRALHYCTCGDCAVDAYVALNMWTCTTMHSATSHKRARLLPTHEVPKVKRTSVWQNATDCGRSLRRVYPQTHSYHDASSMRLHLVPVISLVIITTSVYPCKCCPGNTAMLITHTANCRARSCQATRWTHSTKMMEWEGPFA